MTDERDDPEDDSEDPSPEDIRRFSKPELSRCPDCGTEVDAIADICPKCHAFLFHDEQRKRSLGKILSPGLIKLLVIILALALSGLAALLMR